MVNAEYKMVLQPACTQNVSSIKTVLGPRLVTIKNAETLAEMLVVLMLYVNLLITTRYAHAHLVMKAYLKYNAVFKEWKYPNLNVFMIQNVLWIKLVLTNNVAILAWITSVELMRNVVCKHTDPFVSAEMVSLEMHIVLVLKLVADLILNVPQYNPV